MLYVHFSSTDEWLDELDFCVNDTGPHSIGVIRLSIRTRAITSMPIRAASVVASFIHVDHSTACCLEQHCGDLVSHSGDDPTNEKTNARLDETMEKIRSKVASLGLTKPRSGAVIEPTWRTG